MDVDGKAVVHIYIYMLFSRQKKSRSMYGIKRELSNQAYRSVGRGEKSLVSDPGSELRLRRDEKEKTSNRG